IIECRREMRKGGEDNSGPSEMQELTASKCHCVAPERGECRTMRRNVLKIFAPALNVMDFHKRAVPWRHYQTKSRRSGQGHRTRLPPTREHAPLTASRRSTLSCGIWRP